MAVKGVLIKDTNLSCINVTFAANPRLHVPPAREVLNRSPKQPESVVQPDAILSRNIVLTLEQHYNSGPNIFNRTVMRKRFDSGTR